ncbi:hypothetical protein H2200_001333 [Cladophialophora chaetospira]|uniref:Uncharacterized protein n=1 Tax=Cladophialophora chaetospira TaxID=386627 RepID=A0AA38XKP7_9EURO|nr:hypothetical protein H2200_001333 [Cladophialophora chaetospira]
MADTSPTRGPKKFVRTPAKRPVRQPIGPKAGSPAFEYRSKGIRYWNNAGMQGTGEEILNAGVSDGLPLDNDGDSDDSVLSKEKHEANANTSDANVFSSKTPPAKRLRTPIQTFNRLLPQSLREVDLDYYLFNFQDQLATLRTKNLRANTTNGFLPASAINAIIFITALSSTIDDIKKAQRRGVSLDSSMQRAQIQKLLDEMDQEYNQLANTGEKDDAGFQMDPEFQAAIITNQIILRGRLEGLKPHDVGITAAYNDACGQLRTKLNKTLMFWIIVLIVGGVIGRMWLFN